MVTSPPAPSLVLPDPLSGDGTAAPAGPLEAVQVLLEGFVVDWQLEGSGGEER